MNSDSGENLPESGTNSPESGKIWPAFFCFVFFSLSFMIFLGPKIVGKEQIWPGTWRRRSGFTGFRQIPEFVGFRQIFQISPESDEIFSGITVEDMLGTKKLLLMSLWEKVPTLRNFETSRGHIAIF
jgi:hypothetical protein